MADENGEMDMFFSDTRNGNFWDSLFVTSTDNSFDINDYVFDNGCHKIVITLGENANVEDIFEELKQIISIYNWDVEIFLSE